MRRVETVLETLCRHAPSVVVVIAASWLLLFACCCYMWRAWPRPPDIISGQVLDEAGPVEGAVVRFPGRPGGTQTDGAGNFSLTPPALPAPRVSAWKPGYFIAGTQVTASPARIQLKRHPEVDEGAYAWLAPWPDPSAPRNCANCHRQIYEEWRSSAHARSATNRYFLSLYEGTDWSGAEHAGWSLLGEYPHGAGVCTACHAPAVSPDDPAFLDLRLARGVSAQGVHCDFCHKVREANDEASGLTHGRFGLQLLRPSEGQLFFGPLDDVVGNDTYAPVYQDSRYCASCHEGVMFGVRVYSTYSEWQQSPAARRGQHCQACHMTPSGQLHNLAPGQGGVRRDPATLASHSEPGPRDDILRQCLHVETRVAPFREAWLVAVTVGLEGVGHWLPTGFIDRQLILTVEAQDANGQVLAAESGPTLPEIVGSWRGRSGRLYAKQPRGFDGHSPVPFWRAQPELLDTRLRPDQPDRAEFVFPRQTRSVRVRLLYRRFWEEVTEAKRWPSTDISVVDRLIPCRDR